MQGIFVVGTDTGVGKTEIACLLIRELKAAGKRVGAYKPVCSGAITNHTGLPEWEDVSKLSAALNNQFPQELISPQRFKLPLAPPFAAREEDVAIDEFLTTQGVKKWLGLVDYLIIEGAGGLLSPLTERMSNADYARKISCPLLVVGRMGLGTINHTLLTLNCCEAKRLPVGGVVLSETLPPHSDLSTKSNFKEIRIRTTHPVLGYLPHQATTLYTDHYSGLIKQPQPITIDWTNIADEIILNEGIQ